MSQRRSNKLLKDQQSIWTKTLWINCKKRLKCGKNLTFWWQKGGTKSLMPFRQSSSELLLHFHLCDLLSQIITCEKKRSVNLVQFPFWWTFNICSCIYWRSTDREEIDDKLSISKTIFLPDFQDIYSSAHYTKRESTRRGFCFGGETHSVFRESPRRKHRHFSEAFVPPHPTWWPVKKPCVFETGDFPSCLHDVSRIMKQIQHINGMLRIRLWYFHARKWLFKYK